MVGSLSVKASAGILLFLFLQVQFISVNSQFQEVFEPVSYQPHIKINGDSAFNSSNGVHSGSGIESDPYIIEDLTINCSTGVGINIEGTTKYLTIRNCSFRNGTQVNGSGNGVGIILREVMNCRIENCTFLNIYVGISFRLSAYVSIENNHFLNESLRAIDIQYQNKEMKIVNNNISGCFDGIYGYNPLKAQITGNNIENGRYAIDAISPKDTLIGSNHIEEMEYGIRIQSGKENVRIYENDLNGNNCSIHLFESTNVLIYENRINNSASSIQINSFSSTLVNNTIMNSISGLTFNSCTAYSNKFINSSVCPDPYIGNVILPENNTVNGKKIKYVEFAESYAVSSEEDVGEYIFNRVRVLDFDDLTMKGMVYSMFVLHSVWVAISNSTFEDLYSGPNIYNSNNVMLNNLKLKNVSSGLSLIDCGKVSLANNSVVGCGNEGILGDAGLVRGMGQYAYHFVNNFVLSMKNNSATDCKYGIYATTDHLFLLNNSIQKCGIGLDAAVNDADILNNDLSHNYVAGMNISESGTLGIEFNNCSFNGGPGMNIRVSYNFVIRGNTVNNNSRNAIRIDPSPKMHEGHISTISENSMNGNGRCGIDTNVTCDLANNSICANGLYGINLTRDKCRIGGNLISLNPTGIATNASYCEFFSNRIIGNDRGINFSFAYENALYDNYFSNILDHCGNSYYNNEWNITKTIGKNILGNDFIAGNYWLGYAGGDRDGDGIGDTLVPFGPGDLSPIVVIPSRIWIEDRTPRDPCTGRPHTTGFLVRNSSADSVVSYEIAIYHFKSGAVIKTDHFNGTKIAPDKWINHSFKVDNNADEISYYLNIKDAYGNTAAANGRLKVNDTLPPKVVRSSLPVFKTGENTQVLFEIDENIMMGSATMTCDFVDKGNTSLELEGEEKPVDGKVQWSFEFMVPETARSIWLGLNMIDMNGLESVHSFGPFPVSDVIAPLITDHNAEPVWELNHTSLIFDIRDNIALQYNYIEIDFGFEGSKERRILAGDGGTFVVPIFVPYGSSVLSYVVESIDRSGNHLAIIGSLPVIQKGIANVEDTTKGYPENGQPFMIQLSISLFSDNTTYESYYRLDEGDERYFRAQNFMIIGMIPFDARVLHYGVIASDIYGRNEDHTFDRAVSDRITPSITLSYGEAETGGSIQVEMEIRENRILNGSSFRYDVGMGWIVPEEEDGSYQVDVPSTSRMIVLNATAWDSSDNIGSFQAVVKVRDTIYPMIGILNHSVTYDEDMALVSLKANAFDNVELSRVWVQWFFEGTEHVVDLVKNGTRYEGRIWVVRDPGYIRIVIYASDLSGNTAAGMTETIPLKVVSKDDRQGIPLLSVALLAVCIALSGIAIYVYLGWRRIHPVTCEWMEE